MANATERQLWLMRTLRRYRQLTLAEIANKYYAKNGEKYSRSSFKRDIKAIWDVYNVNIACEQQREYSYYFLTNPDELEEGSPMAECVDRQAEYLRIKSIIQEQKELGDTDFGNRIQFEYSSSGGDLLTKVLKAMKESVVISFSYQSYWEDEKYQITFQPYFIKEARRRWYVIGLNIQTNEIDSFCLERMSDMNFSSTHFTVPDGFNYKTYFDDSYGVLIEEGIKKQEVIIKVWGEQVKYLRSLPLHHSQTEIKKRKDYSVFQFQLKPTYDFKMEVLSHGSSWEVLKPDWFRKDVASGFRMGYRLYYVDGRENKSEECRKMRELLQSWIPTIKKYTNEDSIVFIDDVKNPREPQIAIEVNKMFSVIIGYNDLDKLYYGIKFIDASGSNYISENFDETEVESMLELTASEWLGWHKTTEEIGLTEFEKILHFLNITPV